MATRIHIVKVFIPTMLVFCFVLSACSQQTPTPAPIAEVLPTEVTFSPTEIPLIVISTTPTLLPTSEKETPSEEVGIIVFAMGDAGNQHLFVYHPNYLPITRLTHGDWDDSDPAISPDGNSLVFTSNRSGQWDIYILDITTDQTRRITNSEAYDGSPAWSPDGQNIVYQTKQGKKIDLIIQSVNIVTYLF